MQGSETSAANICVAADSHHENSDQFQQKAEARASQTDERDRVADERERLLDERERLLDEREPHFYGQLAPGSGRDRAAEP